MKKFTKVFVVILLMLTLVMSLAACATSGTLGKDEQGRFKLMVPKVTIENDVIKWDKVRYCESYGIKIDDKEEEVIPTTFCSLSNLVDGGTTVSVKVRAIGDNDKTVSSAYSNAIKFTAPMWLSVPQNIQIKGIEEEAKQLVISWDKVDNATRYEVEMSRTLSKDISTYPVSETQLTIEKDDISSPDNYAFKVRAIGNNDNFLDSGFSNKVEYLNSVQLDAPQPEMKKSTISWDEVENAGRYRIYMEKISGADASSDKILVDDLSKTSRTMSYDRVKDALESYKKDWESKNSNQKFDTTGEYNIYVQAVHASNSIIYESSNIEDGIIKKAVSEEEGAEKNVLTFKKPAQVQGIRIAINEEIGTAENPKQADMLYWDKVEGYEHYLVSFYSNGENITSPTIADVKDDLTARFDDISKNIGKVIEISVSVAYQFNDGVLDGEPVYYKANAGDEKNGQYQSLPKDFVQGTGDDDNKLRIANLGDLQLMMTTDTTNKEFYLAENINGSSSGTNCNFYVGTGTFKGVFDGRNRMISNINLIVKNTEKAISLFNEIAEGAVFKNVIFNNITIKCEDSSIECAALIAKTNKGTIEGVNIINSTFESKSKVAGIALVNDGTITGCGFMGNKIKVDGNKATEENTGAVVGNIADSANIVIDNNSTIFNVTVFNSPITATTKLQNINVGGIAVNNKGTISNSFVRNSLIKATTTNTSTAVAGGLVANNSGNISVCYMSNTASNSQAVEARITESELAGTRNSIAGGLVGTMSAGSIDKCYVSSAQIEANFRASGLVGKKEGTSSIAIENCYVFRIGFVLASDRAMILTDTEGVNASAIYCVTAGQKANTNNAKDLKPAELMASTLEIDGFVKYTTDFTEQPILKNMIYVTDNKYSVEYSKNATRSLQVYMFTDSGKVNCTATHKCELTTSGKNVDIYSSPETIETKLVLPIYVTVK